MSWGATAERRPSDAPLAQPWRKRAERPALRTEARGQVGAASTDRRPRPPPHTESTESKEVDEFVLAGDGRSSCRTSQPEAKEVDEFVLAGDGRFSCRTSQPEAKEVDEFVWAGDRRFSCRTDPPPGPTPELWWLRLSTHWVSLSPGVDDCGYLCSGIGPSQRARTRTRSERAGATDRGVMCVDRTSPLSCLLYTSPSPRDRG